jgi:CarD family transcriptional regulator, regulator of rRNA transcription
MAKKAASKAKKKAPAKKAPAKKAVSKKAPARKTAAKKAITKKKAPVKKATAKKTATKKATTKKTATKKPVSKKVTARKAPAKKVAKKTTTKKATAKKTVKKAAPKKSAVKKAPVKKATVKKAVAKKPAVKKAAAKKVATKKVAPKTAAKATPKTTTNKAGAATAKSARQNSSKAAPKAAKLKDKNPPVKKKEEPVPTPSNAIAKAPLPRSIRRQARPVPSKPDIVFKVNEQIVYPAHGVGIVTAQEEQSIAGMTIKLYVVNFAHEKMILRVPLERASPSGMRHLCTPEQIDKAVELLQGRARVKRTMWSRRAQEYEAKINSGSIKQVAEVVRDLFRSAEQPEQSYSERQLFEAAQERMAREVAAVRKFSQEEAIAELQASLAKKDPV